MLFILERKDARESHAKIEDGRADLEQWQC